MAETKAKATENKEEQKVSKFGKQHKHTAHGVQYIMQFPGTRRVQEILDNSMVRGQINETIYNEQLMEDVIVQPSGLTFEYWDENDGYREVMKETDRFLGGLL